MLRAPGVLFTGLRVLQLPASMYHLSRHRVVVFTTCEPMEAAYILPGVNSRLGLCMRLPGCSLDMFHVVWYHRIAILTVHFNGGGASLMFPSLESYSSSEQTQTTHLSLFLSTCFQVGYTWLGLISLQLMIYQFIVHHGQYCWQQRY